MYELYILMLFFDFFLQIFASNCSPRPLGLVLRWFEAMDDTILTV